MSDGVFRGIRAVHVPVGICYAEAALGLSKTIGDLAGPCMFAITMGISRMIFGKYGDKMDLMKFMAGSGILCVFCYLLASLSSNPAAGLIGCIVCGFSVGIMWLVPSVFPLRNFQPAEPPCLPFLPWQETLEQHRPWNRGACHTECRR